MLSVRRLLELIWKVPDLPEAGVAGVSGGGLVYTAFVTSTISSTSSREDVVAINFPKPAKFPKIIDEIVLYDVDCYYDVMIDDNDMNMGMTYDKH